MIYEAVTETGARYRIDPENRFWLKVSRDGVVGSTEKLADLQVGLSKSTPWHNPEDWTKAEVPVVDRHLYVGALRVWHVSTLVVEVNEVDSLYPV